MLARLLNRAQQTHEISLYHESIDPESLGIVLSSAEVITDLKRLDLSNNTLDDSTVEQLSNLLQNSQSLTTLALSNTGNTDQVIDAISSSQSLEDVDLSSNSFELKDVQAVAYLLMNNRSIHSLDLSYNNIDTLGAEWLSYGILDNKTLKELNLSNNKISDDGISSILNALQKIGIIEKLDISNNSYSDAIIDAIMGMLKSCFSLKSFSMSKSKITDEFLIKISSAVYFTKSLVELNIDTSDCGMGSIIEFEKALVNSPNLIHTNHVFISPELYSKFKAKKRYLEQLAAMLVADPNIMSYEEYTLLEFNQYKYALELIIEANMDLIAKIESELERRGIANNKPNIDSISLTNEPDLPKSVEYSISDFPQVTDNTTPRYHHNHIDLPYIDQHRTKEDEPNKDALKLLD